MALLPYRCGNADRADLAAIQTSLIQSLGDAVTNDVGSNLYVWTVAFARALYAIWAVNMNASNQFDPQAIDSTLTQWETFFQLRPNPNDTLQDRRNALTNKFGLLNQIPNHSNIVNLMKEIVPLIFELIVTISQVNATGGYGDGYINGGLENIISTNWFSTAASIYIDLHKPDNMTQFDFWTQAYTVFPALNQYLPAWDYFDWFSSSYNTSDGYGNQSTISVSGGSINVTTTGHSLLDGYYVTAGTIIEAFDDNGFFRRLLVGSIVNATHLHLATPAPSVFTNQRFWIEGFFVDDDPSQPPYPLNAFNVDNAGIDAPPTNFV